MVPPPHHLFLRWEPEAPLPRAGLLSFWEELKRSRSVLPPPCGEVGAQLRSSSEAVAQTRLRAGWGGETSIPSKMQTPHPDAAKGVVVPPHEGEVWLCIGAREPHRQAKGYPSRGPANPSTPQYQVAGSESCVSVEKPRHCPGASSLLRRTAEPLDSTSPLGSIADPSDTAEEAMPGDPKECREHARRCAELAKARDHA